MRHDSSLTRPVSCWLVLSLLLFVCEVPLTAAEKYSRVSSIDWFFVGTEIVIEYDLEGAADETYNVSMRLLRESNKSFSLTPRVLLGDHGKGITIGKKKEIRWTIDRDELSSLRGKDFYFELTAEQEGGFPWVIVAGGAAMGGALVFLLSSSPRNETSQSSFDLPYPPNRP